MAIAVYDDDDLVIAVHALMQAEEDVLVQCNTVKPTDKRPIDLFKEQMSDAAIHCGLTEIPTYHFETVGFETTEFLED